MARSAVWSPEILEASKLSVADARWQRAKEALTPVEGVADVWLGEMETGAAVDDLAEMGGFAGREDAGAVPREHYAAPD